MLNLLPTPAVLVYTPVNRNVAQSGSGRDSSSRTTAPGQDEGGTIGLCDTSVSNLTAVIDIGWPLGNAPETGRAMPAELYLDDNSQRGRRTAMFDNSNELRVMRETHRHRNVGLNRPHPRRYQYTPLIGKKFLNITVLCWTNSSWQAKGVNLGGQVVVSTKRQS